VLASLLLLTGPAFAATITLDFEEEATDARSNGYVSAECGCVTFSHTNLSNALHFANFGAQGDGQALVVGDDDDGGGLVLDFLVPVSSLTLAFGNDDPSIVDQDDEAVLQAYAGATLLGEVHVALNANDLMDQTISISGLGAFDRAVFRYTDSIDEIVDNLVFETLPEPGPPVLAAFAAWALYAIRAPRRSARCTARGSCAARPR